jgi:hypothetical protein
MYEAVFSGIQSSCIKTVMCIHNFCYLIIPIDCLCGLVIRVPGYRPRGPGFDSWRYQIFGEVVSLEQGPLSPVRIIEELLD